MYRILSIPYLFLKNAFFWIYRQIFLLIFKFNVSFFAFIQSNLRINVRQIKKFEDSLKFQTCAPLTHNILAHHIPLCIQYNKKKLIYFLLMLSESRKQMLHKEILHSNQNKKEFNIIYCCYRAVYDAHNADLPYHVISRKMNHQDTIENLWTLLLNSQPCPPLHFKRSTKLNENNNISTKGQMK